MKLTGSIAFALAALLAGWLPVAARAQDGVRSRRMGITWTDRVPLVSFRARDLVNADVRRKLESGLPQTLVMRVYGYPEHGGRSPAVAPRSCRVVYDLWEEVFRVQLQMGTRDRSLTVRSLEEVLSRCLVARAVPVGTAADFATGQRFYFAVLVELNPLSPDTVQRMRRWLARPSGGRTEGEAFFGSFVSLFVNRRIGDAERTIRFRSQAVTVP